MARTDRPAHTERHRRAYLHTHKSEVRWIARRINRQDRHDARTQLRRGLDVEPRQPRGRALWDAI